jgi:transcriptional regulator GlxA family with amidase domain
MISVCFLLLPGTLIMDVAGPAEVFRLANQHLEARGKPAQFALQFISPERTITSSVGLAFHDIAPLPDLSDLRKRGPVWLVLSGRSGPTASIIHHDPVWLTARTWLTRYVELFNAHADSDCALLTICAGALLLADAGLASGRALTTHHDFLGELARLAPQAQVLRNRLYVDDGNLLSSAGITAGIDLALHCVSTVAGEGIASATAQSMRVTRRRHRQEPEISPLLQYRHHQHQALLRVQDAIEADPAAPWDSITLASIAHISPRQLLRIFRQQLGMSARDYIEAVRLYTLAQISDIERPDAHGLRLAGFSGTQQLRRARARQAKREPTKAMKGDVA